MNLNLKRAFELTISKVLYIGKGAQITMLANSLLVESSLDGIVAKAGGGQTNATQLFNEVNEVGTVASAGDSVKLPPAQKGLTVFVVNKGANAMQVFGYNTDTVDDVAAATGVSHMPNSIVIYTCTTAGKWRSNGLATGYSGSLQTLSYKDAISAAGTTQATATPLVAMINTVSSVSAGQGVNLPASAAGLSIVVQNTGSNPLLVYPFQGASDTINGVAAANGVAILPGSVATFNCTAAGAWNTMPASAKSAAFNTASNTTAFTATGAQVTGGTASVDFAITGTLAGAQNVTLPTVANLVLAMHSPTVGSSFRLRIINESGGAFAWTVVTNTGWTLTGTMSIAQNTWREFVVTLTSLTTATLQSVAVGTYS